MIYINTGKFLELKTYGSINYKKRRRSENYLSLRSLIYFELAFRFSILIHHIFFTGPLVFSVYLNFQVIRKLGCFKVGSFEVGLNIALEHLGGILGKTFVDDLLDQIFVDFCIGK